MSVSPLIFVDEEKCVSCHRCISVCPVKFCQDGSGDSVKIIHETCIGCGSCIDACEHDARKGIDDSDAFFKAVQQREKTVAIVAPSAAASFSGNLLRLNGFLKALGVEAVFDVSFGAELTVYSYLRHIEKNNPGLVIAQPCPAIVNYIELYQPELLPYLAPADSPMLHTIKMIREFYPEYAQHKVAVISPCIAKRSEFAATGLGDYNVTFTKLEERLKSSNDKLERYPETDFDSAVPERAVLFSSPGGLKATVERDVPSAGDAVRKIEGTAAIYEYLKELPEAIAAHAQPLLVDCLNCEKGCNGGTGTSVKHVPVDILETAVRNRSQRMRKSYSAKMNDSAAKRKMEKLQKKYWKPGLYDRKYTDRSGSVAIKIPTEREKWAIFNSMNKHDDSDVYNCASCGYNFCESMATAIFNGLNKPENCHHYQLNVLESGREKIVDISHRIDQKIDDANTMMKEIIVYSRNMLNATLEQGSSVEQSSAAVQEMIAAIENMNGLVSSRKDLVDTLYGNTSEGADALNRTLESIQGVYDGVGRIREVVETINGVTSQTDLLAMNAAIEAAHAGDAGKGFAVVADEIRKLSEQTGENSKSIAKDLLSIAEEIQDTRDVSKDTGNRMEQIIARLKKVALSFEELAAAMNQMTTGTREIQHTLDSMLTSTQALQDSSNSVSSIIDSITAFYDDLHNLSKENMKAI